MQIRQQTGPAHPTPAPSERQEHGHAAATVAAHRRDRQAFSMYEPGSALKPFGQPVDELVTRLQPFGSSVSPGGPWPCPPSPWAGTGARSWQRGQGFVAPGAGQGQARHGALTCGVSPGGGGGGDVLHAHPGRRVPGKGACMALAVRAPRCGAGAQIRLPAPVAPGFPPCVYLARAVAHVRALGLPPAPVSRRWLRARGRAGDSQPGLAALCRPETGVLHGPVLHRGPGRERARTLS